MEKLTSLVDILLFVNKTFVTDNERSFPGSSNLSAKVFDMNVESNPPSNNALTQNIFCPFETFIGSTCKCVAAFSLAVWLILLQLSELLFVEGSFMLRLFELTVS